MSGEQLREYIKKSNLSINEIGRRLDMSSQAMNQALNVKDIKTGFLERICEVTDLEMSYFYPFKTTVQVTNNDNAHHNTATGDVSSDTALLDALKDAMISIKKKDEQIDTLLSMMQKK